MDLHGRVVVALENEKRDDMHGLCECLLCARIDAIRDVEVLALEGRVQSRPLERTSPKQLFPAVWAAFAW